MEVFRKAPVRSISPEPISRPGAFYSSPGSTTLTRTSPSSPIRANRRSRAVPGAFPSSTTTSRKPPLPSWVEEPGELERKMNSKCVITESSSMPSHPVASRRDQPSVDIYRQESLTSVQSIGSAGPARADDEDESRNRARVESRNRARIEVAPGHYMPLRGSNEPWLLSKVDGLGLSHVWHAKLHCNAYLTQNSSFVQTVVSSVLFQKKTTRRGNQTIGKVIQERSNIIRLADRESNFELEVSDLASRWSPFHMVLKVSLNGMLNRILLHASVPTKQTIIIF